MSTNLMDTDVLLYWGASGQYVKGAASLKSLGTTVVTQYRNPG